MSDPGKKTISVYLRELLVADAVKFRVDDEFRGNFSSYVEHLIKADLKGEPSRAESNALVALTKRYHPTLASDIESATCAKGVRQDRAIARLLEAVHDFRGRAEELEGPLALVAKDGEAVS